MINFDSAVCDPVQSELPLVVIYTDGACDPNPGPGGWAAILKSGRREITLTGGDPDLPAFTKRWFDDVWPEDVTKAKYVESMIACQRKTGLVDGAIDNSKYHNPAEPDEVDEHCEVGKKLKAYIVSNEGKPKPAARGGK